MAQLRGYLLGRLFALLAAHEVLEGPPTSLYQLASTAPPQVIPKALAGMIEAGKEEILFPLMQQLPLDAFDGNLNRREQGAFALGYMHERSGYSTPLTEEERDSDEPDLTERYEFRLDPLLKEWLKIHGGGAFIRDLLRTERTTVMQGTSPKQLAEGDEEHAS